MTTERIEELETPRTTPSDLIKSARLTELARLEAWVAKWPALSSWGLRAYIAERKAAIERGE